MHYEFMQFDSITGFFKAFETEFNGPTRHAQMNNLYRQLSPGSSPPEVTFQTLSDFFAGHSFLFIVAQGEQLVGMTSLVVSSKLNKKTGYVEDVVVDKPHRGNHLSVQLMMLLFEKAHELKLTQLELTSHPSRVEANALYQKLGFIRRETNVYKLVLQGA